MKLVKVGKGKDYDFGDDMLEFINGKHPTMNIKPWTAYDQVSITAYCVIAYLFCNSKLILARILIFLIG